MSDPNRPRSDPNRHRTRYESGGRSLGSTLSKGTPTGPETGRVGEEFLDDGRIMDGGPYKPLEGDRIMDGGPWKPEPGERYMTPYKRGGRITGG